MNGGAFLTIVLTVLWGVSLLSQSTLALQTQETSGQKAEQKKEDPKEPEAVDIEAAEKEAAKPSPEVGYTKEEYDEFQKAFNLPDPNSSWLHASQRPNTQVAIIAGLMIARSSRRSITLKVSDCFDPASASQ